jgi:hypothetical protein
MKKQFIVYKMLEKDQILNDQLFIYKNLDFKKISFLYIYI